VIILFIVFNHLKTSAKLSEEKFVELYVQLSIASEIYDTDPAKLEEERKKIFEKYGVAQEKLDQFVKEYNQNPEKWANVWEKIVRRLEEEVDRSSKEKTTPP
jgi:DNA anti-recombination protein RmuC